MENDGDDSDQDTDYIEEKDCSSSSDEEDAEGGQNLVTEANKRYKFLNWTKFTFITNYISFLFSVPATPEIRVYMDPPVERPDGDTDKDSGIVFFSVAEPEPV